jgi:single stranded DNA-binding protein (ssb)
MAGVNKAILLGHLGRDPEMKISQSGTSVCRFSLAVSEKYNNQQQTEWFNCVSFGKLAEIVDQYLSKGSQAYIEGRIQTRKYQAKDGSDRYSTDVIVNNLVMLGNNRGQGGKPSPAQPTDDDPFAGEFGPPPTEDDMPF